MFITMWKLYSIITLIMQFDDFIRKHTISLSPAIDRCCRHALAIMEQSNDALHTDKHIQNLFQELDILVGYEKRSIDYDILLPALCWHDIWYAIQPTTNNTFVIVFRIFYEAYGSAKCFLGYTKQYPIDQNIIQEIYLAIRRHARTGVRFIDHVLNTPHSYEAQVLRDLDELDVWSIQRLELVKKQLFENKLPGNYLWLIHWYLHWMVPARPENLFFLQYSKTTFRRKIQTFISWMIQNYAEIRNHPEKYIRGSYQKKLLEKTPEQYRLTIHKKFGLKATPLKP